MKYGSLILVVMSLLLSIYSLHTFHYISSAELVAAMVRFVNDASPAYEYTARSRFEITNRTSTYLYIALSVVTATIASAIEIKQLNKLGKNSRSAAVIALAAALFFINYNIYSWNDMPV
ncbi:MAG: hypothetical protein ACPGR2_07255 [Psychrobium sp.]